jgi:tripartite ATP-independent transporter DctM subunit
MIGQPIGRLFLGAVMPGLLLVVAYILYIAWKAWQDPYCAPALAGDDHAWDRKFFMRVFKSLFPALVLVIAVLGSIFMGIASPTESAAMGAIGAVFLALSHNRLTLQNLLDAMRHTTRLTSMVFLILIGATAFGLVFRGMEGDHLVHDLFTHLPGEKWGFILVSQLLIFMLGFFLDFLEICFIVVPILAPIAQHFNIDPLWFGILIAVNLQTSFLTPPFGFSLFYLKAVAPPSMHIGVIYQGIIPYVILQVFVLLIIAIFPELALWLPNMVDRWHGF